MVVGPRYNPGTPISSAADTPAKLQGKVSPPVADTDRVPDAARISPPVLKPGVRNGHDISLSVQLDAGVPIQDLTSRITAPTYRATATTRRRSLSPRPIRFRTRISCCATASSAKSPRWRCWPTPGTIPAMPSGRQRLLHADDPAARKTSGCQRARRARSCFWCDVSGSMSGEPTDKVIEAMQDMLKLCREQDTCRSSRLPARRPSCLRSPCRSTKRTSRRPRTLPRVCKAAAAPKCSRACKLAIDEPIDKEAAADRRDAHRRLHRQRSRDHRARRQALRRPDSLLVRRHRAAPNMFLVDGVAKQGGGMGKQLGLQDDSAALAQEIMTTHSAGTAREGEDRLG